MKTILIIDDEKDLVDILKDTLEDEGYLILTAYNGYNGIKKSKLYPDLIILDIMMPDIDGFNVCRSIRDNVKCPIIFLSAKSDEIDKLKGLCIGGDDYITKPFSLKELVFRVQAHLRREERYNLKEKDIIVIHEELKLNLKVKNVFIGDRNINLIKKEYEILELL